MTGGCTSGNLIQPCRETLRIVQRVDSLQDLHPGLLQDIRRIHLRCNQSAHIVKQSPFPLTDQLVQCLFLPSLTAENQQFQQDGIFVSRQRLTLHVLYSSRWRTASGSNVAPRNSPARSPRPANRGIRMVGPLGRKVMENGLSRSGDPITRAVPFAGRTPGPLARMGFGGLAHGSCRPRISGVPRRVCPEGASVLPAKGDALVAEAVHRPPVFPPPFLRPNGPTVLRERGVRSPRTPSEPHRNRLLRAGGPFTVLSAVGGLRPVVHDGLMRHTSPGFVTPAAEARLRAFSLWLA